MKPARTVAQIIMGVLVLLSVMLMLVVTSSPMQLASAQGDVIPSPTPIPTSTPPPSLVLTVDVLDDSSDGVCDQNSCSLRDAITEANQQAEFSVVEIYLPNGTITFNQTDNNGTMESAAPNALPVIERNISIAGITTLQIDEQAEPMRFFEVVSGASLTLVNATLKHGEVGNADGGAVYSNGDLVVYDAAFEGNSANDGGAIYMTGDGHLAVYNTEFRDNSALVAGGAIARPVGARVFNWLRLFESEFYGNMAGQQGGAIFGNGNVDIPGSVFANNRVSSGDKGHVLYTNDNETTKLQSIYNNCLTNNGNEQLQDQYVMYSDGVEIKAELNWWGGIDSSLLNFNTDSDPELSFVVNGACPVLFAEYFTLESNPVDNDFTVGTFGGTPPYTYTILSPPSNGTLEDLGDNVFRYTYQSSGAWLPRILDEFEYMVTDANGLIAYQRTQIARISGESNFDGVITPADVIAIINRVGEPVEDNIGFDLNVDGAIDAVDAEILVEEIGLTPLPNPTPLGQIPLPN